MITTIKLVDAFVQKGRWGCKMKSFVLKVLSSNRWHMYLLVTKRMNQNFIRSFCFFSMTHIWIKIGVQRVNTFTNCRQLNRKILDKKRFHVQISFLKLIPTNVGVQKSYQSNMSCTFYTKDGYIIEGMVCLYISNYYVVIVICRIQHLHHSIMKYKIRVLALSGCCIYSRPIYILGTSGMSKFAHVYLFF